MKTFAVVDIETTGTDPKTDRIIQFGCVLIQHGQIVSRFATDVNPDKRISKQIQNLTQISNARVRKAPYFEDIAFTIANLLSETIFVAHNIYFDYKFLNSELVRCGAPELTIPGIDTVELAQIFLPTETSFRLSDLAESLGLEHDNPHQADSDAEVTGALLLYIEGIMRQLPVITLRQIAERSHCLGMQTGEYIKQILIEELQKTRILPPDLEVVADLVLRKRSLPVFEETLTKPAYPKHKKGKEQLFQGKLTFRKEQARLMNLVYSHFTQTEEKNLLIEAATGMGKTIGYLLPVNFLATPENPVIISTTSLLLQDQLLNKDIPLLNQVLAQPIQAAVVKSQQHYLDLQRFKGTLAQPVKQKQYALYQMAILVWLTQTNTGDLDELNLISLDHQFFRDVKHRGLKYLVKNEALYQQDFLRYLYQRIKQSNFLVTNHAFLAQESRREEPLLPSSDYLIIDEAHHLPAICEQVAAASFDYLKFGRRLQQVSAEGELFDQLQRLIGEDLPIKRWLQLYQEELQALYDSQLDFFNLLQSNLPTDAGSETLINQEQLAELPLAARKAQEKIKLYYQELTEIQQQLQQGLESLAENWLNSERLWYLRLIDLFDQLQQQKQLMTDWLDQWEKRYLHWLRTDPKKGTQIALSDLAAAILPNTKWYDRYDRILYLGGTLTLTGERNYLAKRLGIPEARVKIIQSPFDYERQARLLLPDKGISINELTPVEYSQYLAQVLTTLFTEYQKPILVLFTAHDVLQRVYEQLHFQFLTHGREIYAQGIGGSRDKILKKFQQSGNGILFGADSFWEGIDLPGEALQLVIVTRLPFENPKRPLVQARNEYLIEQGINAFYQDAVPRAALKLRQALGRLIRGQTDRGVLIVLDRRLITTKYGQKMRRALPKNLPINEVPLAEMSTILRTFLEKSATKSENY